MSNVSLAVAKSAKNDEFYTRFEDIREEVNHYEGSFRGKTVFCNCDDPKRSNFWRYFHLNFHCLGLRKLIATHYEGFKLQTYKIEYEGGSDEDFEEGFITPLQQNGDFRSEECQAILDERGKQFLIIGSINAITYKEILPLMKSNTIRLGCRSLSKEMYFDIPEGSKEWLIENKREGSAYKTVNGVIMRRLASGCWFTNLEHKQGCSLLETGYYYAQKDRLYPELYPKYDTYDAIDVSKVAEIPMDYEGIMGVPVTFMGKYNPEQFEIVGEFKHGCDSELDLAKPVINGEEKFTRLAIRRKK